MNGKVFIVLDGDDYIVKVFASQALADAWLDKKRAMRIAWYKDYSIEEHEVEDEQTDASA
jgi:hypothetical protein